MEDGFLVVHCRVSEKDIDDTFVKVTIKSSVYCFVGSSFSKSLSDKCNNITKVHVEEGLESGGYRFLSFPFYTPWIKYQKLETRDKFGTCYCSRVSSDDLHTASFSILSKLKLFEFKKEGKDKSFEIEWIFFYFYI